MAGSHHAAKRPLTRSAAVVGSLVVLASTTARCSAFNPTSTQRQQQSAKLLPPNCSTNGNNGSSSQAQLSSRAIEADIASSTLDVDVISDTKQDELDLMLQYGSASATRISSANNDEDAQTETNPYQMAARATVALTAISYAINPEPLDGLTASLWSAIYNWGPANAPLFEAEVASFAFFAWIAAFSGLHLVLGRQKTMESRFDGQMPTKPFEWAVPENFHLWFNPLGSYLLSIFVYHQFLHEKPPLPELAPTFGVFAIELLFGVFLYDLCFFPIHWLMHKSSWGQMRKVHGYHHRVSSHTLNSLETVQHSYIDGFLQVFVNILVQQITPFGGIGEKHVMSRLAHNVLVTYLLSEAHSGYDLPWMSHRLFPEFLGGAPRHEKHHHDGRVYYQQYFKYLDDFFGFTEKSLRIGDWRKKDVAAAVAAANGEMVIKKDDVRVSSVQ